MKTPRVIYIGKTIWSEEKINDHSPAYFSEEAVRELLREEYKQANNIIRLVSRDIPIDAEPIGVEQSIELAIKRLKGDKQ